MYLYSVKKNKHRVKIQAGRARRRKKNFFTVFEQLIKKKLVIKLIKVHL